MTKKQILKIVYIAVFLLALAVPGAWTFLQKQENIGNEDKTDFSDVTYLNLSEKIDDYMSTGFGFRNRLVQMNSSLYLNLFGESAETSVIAGKDGWLFYEEALHDYMGENVLSDIQAAKIAKVLEIAQTCVEAGGADFIFVSAPNKMEIYGEYMPYYCYEDKSDGNYEKVFDALNKYGVSNVDLKALLRDKAANLEYRIYHKQDSHWNNLGAAYVYEAVMNKAGLEYVDFVGSGYDIRTDFDGDLYGMLFPEGNVKDEQVYFNIEGKAYYTSNFRNLDDMIIETANDEMEGTLLMYRDSFGKSLNYFMAESFGNSVFSRAIPYELTDIADTDLVVIEIVERNLANLLEYPPVVEAMETEISTTEAVDIEISAEITKQSGYNLMVIQAKDMPEECVNVYVRVGTGEESSVYTAYPCGKNGDASLYLKDFKEDTKVSLIYEYNGKNFETGKISVK